MDPASPTCEWQALVERALTGDQSAWRELVDRLKGVAWKVLYGYDLSTEDRNDAFASTFFRVYERLQSIRDPQKLPGWVATIARNEANTIYRKRAKFVPMAEVPLRSVAAADHSERLIQGVISRPIARRRIAPLGAVIRNRPKSSVATSVTLPSSPSTWSGWPVGGDTWPTMVRPSP